MNPLSSHPNHVGPDFARYYPTPQRLLETLGDELTTDGDRTGFVADRVGNRIGGIMLIGGSRAIGLPRSVLANRGVTDMDVGLPIEGPAILELEPTERLRALDELIAGHLAADLGDQVVLKPHRTQSGEFGALYKVTADVAGTRIGDIRLDVDLEPHVTAPVWRDVQPFCSVDFAGLAPGFRTYQNPADVFAGKLDAVSRCLLPEEKSHYARHLCDMYQMLSRGLVDEDLVAGSIAELSRKTNVPIHPQERGRSMYPIRFEKSAWSRYRNRVKKYRPDDAHVDHGVFGHEFRLLDGMLKPIISKAASGQYSATTALDDIARAIGPANFDTPSQSSEAASGAATRPGATFRVADRISRGAPYTRPSR